MNHWVDISATMDVKIAALEAHLSQLGEWAADGAMAREMRKWGADAAARVGQGWQYAEGFHRIGLYGQEDAAPTEAEAEGGRGAGLEVRPGEPGPHAQIPVGRTSFDRLRLGARQAISRAMRGFRPRS